MWICYVDEAGCTGALPASTSPVQPVFVILGIIVDQTRLRTLTFDFLDLKRAFFPRMRLRTGKPPATYLEWVLGEIKGAELRRCMCSSRRKRRHAIGFLDKLFWLLQKHHVRLVGRVFVKAIGAPFDGTAVYTSSMQLLCAAFHHHLGQ